MSRYLVFSVTGLVRKISEVLDILEIPALLYITLVHVLFDKV